MQDLNFYHIEPCILCDGAGQLETDQTDFYGNPETVECPCCRGAGELRVYGRKEKPNE